MDRAVEEEIVRAIERKEWLKCDTPDAGFTLNPYTFSIGCRCKHHKDCEPNRVATKLPVGWFMAWLAIAKDPEYSTRELHFKARRDPDVVAYANRLAGRDKANADPVCERLLSWEIPRGKPEPEKVSP